MSTLKNHYDVIHNFCTINHNSYTNLDSYDYKKINYRRFNNIFYEYNKIYSYGRHYLLGEIKTINGIQTIFINNEYYSVCTAKHKNMLISASSQYKQIFLSQYLDHLVYKELENLYTELQTARIKSRYILQIQNLIEKYKENKQFCNEEIPQIYSLRNGYYGSSTELEFSKYENELLKYNLNELIETENKKRLVQLEKKHLRQLEKQKLNIEKFYNFEINSIYLANSLLRINKDKQVIETSQAVKIPFRDAKLLYIAIKNNKNIIGQKLTNYTILENNENYIKIGCHKILKTEIHKIGEELLTIEF